MEQQPPEEISGGQALNDFLTVVVFNAKGDDSIMIMKNILLCDHAAIQVATEIDQCLMTSAYLFAINNPLFRHGIFDFKPQLLDVIKHLGAKDFG